MHPTPAVPRFANEKVVQIGGVDHLESLAVGVRGLRLNHPAGRGMW